MYWLVIAPKSLRLRDFMEDSLDRTGTQIRESTHDECRAANFLRLAGRFGTRKTISPFLS